MESFRELVRRKRRVLLMHIVVRVLGPYCQPKQQPLTAVGSIVVTRSGMQMMLLTPQSHRMVADALGLNTSRSMRIRMALHATRGWVDTHVPPLGWLLGCYDRLCANVEAQIEVRCGRLIEEYQACYGADKTDELLGRRSA